MFFLTCEMFFIVSVDGLNLTSLRGDQAGDFSYCSCYGHIISEGGQVTGGNV